MEKSFWRILTKLSKSWRKIRGKLIVPANLQLSRSELHDRDEVIFAEAASRLYQPPDLHLSWKNRFLCSVKVDCQVRYVPYVIGLDQKRAACQIQRGGKSKETLQSFSLLVLFWIGVIDKRRKRISVKMETHPREQNANYTIMTKKL